MLLLLVSFFVPSVSTAAAPPPVPDSTHFYYAQRDVQALRRLLQDADTPGLRFLCRYRLYPLTEDERYLDDLPDVPTSDASARELALLAGLWGYRAARASFFNAMQAGRRSMRFLKTARQKEPEDPLVLLITGQSLLFRPALVGGSDEEALRHFRQLRAVIASDHPEGAVAPTEAALWTWYALRETGRQNEADALYRQLSSDDLPPLYREFLDHPPE